MKNKLLFLKLFFAIVFLFSFESQAQILDQSNTTGNESGFFVNNSTSNVGQSFIAGLTGELKEFHIRIGDVNSTYFTAGDFEFTLFSGNGIANPVLATQNFTISSVPSNGYVNYTIVLPSGIAMVAGSTYTVEMKGITGSVLIVGTSPATYTSGGLYYNGGQTGLYNSYDLWFKTFITSGSSLNFDGIDDKVVIGNTMNTILDPLNTITVEAWVNSANTTFNGVIIGNYHNSTNTEMQFLLRRDFDTFTFWVNDGTGFKTVDSGLASVVVNTWQHVAGVWDGSSLHIYVDGILKGTTTGVTGSSFATTNNNIVIGSNSYPEHYAGSIDEVRIWNRALNQCEIQNNMNGELSSGQTGLLAYYQFNQGVANADNTAITTLIDDSGNGNNGTLTNFTLTGTTSNWVADGAVVSGSTNPLYALPNTTITNSSDVLTVAENTASYQWATCDGNNVYTSISGATSQSYTATSTGDYAVFVTRNGCAYRSSCFTVGTLGTTTFNEASFSYYPNPTTGILNLNYSKEITEITVVNLVGQTVITKKANDLEVQLDLATLSPGTYLVKIVSEGVSKTIKVLKQ